MDEAKEPSMYWRMAAELTIRQAALLIVGIEPSSEIGTHCENWKEHERPDGYEAVKQALVSALRKNLIKGESKPYIERDINGNECGEYEGTTDVNSSLLEFDSLVGFLALRNLRPPFFFPPDDSANGEPDYLNRNHPRHCKKLEAAVRAWQAVTDAGGKSARQALEKWLREHAARFGLTNEDGSPVKTAIEECAKVANWETGGGAPSTPKTAKLSTSKA